MIFGKIADLFGGIVGAVDEFVTTDEERLAIKSNLLTIQSQVVTEALAAERAELESRAKIIEAEAKSESWLTSNWRPLTMITFVCLIVLHQFGVGPPLHEDMWPLLKLGLGGYVIGRSVEKTIPAVTHALKAREEA